MGQMMSLLHKGAAWVRGDQNSDVVIGNSKLGTFVLHVMNLNDKGQSTYDQILRAEQGGGAFLPIQGNKVGLQKRIRPQTNDQAAYAKNFTEQLAAGNLSKLVEVEKLGRISWEIPRGFPKLGEAGAATALREAQEETQSEVTESSNLGFVCDNTAFSPHLTEMRFGKIDPSKKPKDKPDPNEKLLSGVVYYDFKGMNELIAKGELYCAYTLSAIGLWLIKNATIKT